MKTPICDFVSSYCETEQLRLHMPGHKGREMFGMEPYDITEISGADSLYEASGIIKESEENAAALFGTAATFYSAEGSSLCIRTMLYLALLYGKQKGKRPVVVAGRNAHKTFVTAAGLLDFDICWMYPKNSESYLSCSMNKEKLEQHLQKENPVAVYITCPDYLGAMTDVASVSKLCKKYDTLLLVDNAHGAYLKFLEESKHPIDLGADMCCDSAHKTLPVLTGGAYLHLADSVSKELAHRAKSAMALFGSTSPSYLILQSLDRANCYIESGYQEKLQTFVKQAEVLKERLAKAGYHFVGNEPLKWTIETKSYGYLGTEFAEALEKKGIVSEFADPDYVVFMLTCEIGEQGLLKLQNALEELCPRTPIDKKAPVWGQPEQIYTVRETLFMERETLPVELCEGKVLASLNVGCPPAVPIVVCGERMTQNTIEAFQYYKIHSCEVVKNVV